MDVGLFLEGQAARGRNSAGVDSRGIARSGLDVQLAAISKEGVGDLSGH